MPPVERVHESLEPLLALPPRGLERQDACIVVAAMAPPVRLPPRPALAAKGAVLALPPRVRVKHRALDRLQHLGHQAEEPDARGTVPLRPVPAQLGLFGLRQ